MLGSTPMARSVLAELKQAAELIPSQGMLINTIPLLETQGSSIRTKYWDDGVAGNAENRTWCPTDTIG